MPTEEETEEAAKAGYTSAIAQQYASEELAREHRWEVQPDALRDDWRETARYMLARVATDRDRLLAALKDARHQIALEYGIRPGERHDAVDEIDAALDGR